MDVSCPHRTSFGYCYYSACINPKYCTSSYIVEQRPTTNYDRIISKSPEELADFLWSIGNNPATGNYYLNGKLLFSCADGNGWLDWLRQEATDGT